MFVIRTHARMVDNAFPSTIQMMDPQLSASALVIGRVRRVKKVSGVSFGIYVTE